MTRQGYLMLHEKRARPRVVFFVLEDGFLRFYANAACAQRLGEFKLSGCKLAVKAHKRADSVPHSFFVETRKVFVKDRSYTLGNPVRVELSANSNEDRQEWGKALFSWQRYYWRDPGAEPSTAAASTIDDAAVKEQLEELVDKFFGRESGGSSYALSFAAAKQPLSFLRRNAYSLRRSISFSTVSAASTPSTVSSSSSSSSSSSATLSRSSNQQPSAGDNNKKTCGVAQQPTDCEKDKVVLMKVASCVTAGHRGNNQEFH